MIEIVQADSVAEIAVARELFLEYQRWLDLDLCFQSFAEELASLPGAYAPPSGRLLMARQGEEYAGCVALRAVDEERCEMKRLFVRPSFQGLGLGRKLVNAVIAEATSLGYRHLCLDTLPCMETAQALYLSLGFQDIEPYTFNPVPGARYMGLILNSAG